MQEVQKVKALAVKKFVASNAELKKLQKKEKIERQEQIRLANTISKILDDPELTPQSPKRP